MSVNSKRIKNSWVNKYDHQIAFLVAMRDNLLYYFGHLSKHYIARIYINLSLLSKIFYPKFIALKLKIWLFPMIEMNKIIIYDLKKTTIIYTHQFKIVKNNNKSRRFTNKIYFRTCSCNRFMMYTEKLCDNFEKLSRR